MIRSAFVLMMIVILLAAPGCNPVALVLPPTATPTEAPTPTPSPSPAPTDDAASAPSPSAEPAAALEPLPEMGHPAPDFTLTTLDGAEVSLGELQGQVVVLNFWASWCMPCRVEMPEFESVYDKYKGEGVVILGINVAESPARASSAAEALGISFPVPLDRDGQVAALYEVLGYHTTFLVDREGIIRGMQVGQMRGATLEAAIKEFL